MITPLSTTAPPAVSPTSQRFSMVVGRDDRMAGSVPVYQRFGDFLEKSADSEGQQLGFSDVIDTLNPLHHIPVVSHFYEKMTGDRIGSLATIIGGGLFGGPLGIVAGMGMVAFDAAKGKDAALPHHDITLSPLNANDQYNT